MSIYALVFLGSGIGGMGRFMLINLTYRLLGTHYPYGTIVVNIIGSFLMGICFELIFEHFMAYSSHLKAFVMIGFLGGFTTFSSFSLEAYEFFKEGDYQKALLYIMMQVVMGIMALFFGIRMVKVGAY